MRNQYFLAWVVIDNERTDRIVRMRVTSDKDKNDYEEIRIQNDFPKKIRREKMWIKVYLSNPAIG